MAGIQQLGEIKLRVSGDHFSGDPNFQVFVDGEQVGGTFGVQAIFSQGSWQEISIPGSINTSVGHKIELRFTNDLCVGGGVGEGFDRNLFVDWMEIGGQRYEGENAQNTASLGYDGMLSGAAEMLTNGKLTFTSHGGDTQPAPAPNPAPAPAPVEPAPSPAPEQPAASPVPPPEPAPSPVATSIKVHASADHFNGDPQFQLFVDGKQVGGTYGVQAVFNKGQWQDIDIAANIDPSAAHKVELRFINDFSGSGGTGEGFDRNMFVDWIEIGGQRYEGERAQNTASLGYDGMLPGAAEMLANGSLTFTTAPGSVTGPSPAPAPTPAPSTPDPVPTTPTPTPQPTPSGSAKFFAADSLWNTPIADNPQLASNSDSIASKLDNSGFGFQLNQSAWGVNVAYAQPGTARTTVRTEWSESWGHWEATNVPVTPDTFGTSDSDGHLVIIDPELGKIWNFWGAGNFQTDNTVSAMGVFDINGSGWWDPTVDGGSPWSGRSSNASYLGGLILPEELKAGAIHHALAVGIDVSLMSDTPAKPALTTDGNGVPGGIPNGSRLQLDPNLDLDTLGLGPEARIVAEALQEYGAFVTERTSGFALYFQSNQNLDSDPYAGMNFAGLDESLHDHWRVIAPEAPKSYDSVETQPYVHKVMIPFE